MQVVPIETQNTEHFLISSPEEFRQATRHEHTLVQDYQEFLDTHQGLKSVRLKILPSGETNPIYTDLFIESQNLLVEAKSSADRISIRMAIGQLYDYARFRDPRPDLAVLLPERPSDDLVALLKERRISIICRSASGEFNRLNAKAD